MDATAPEYHLHQSYWTQLVPLGLRDADDMHRLAVAVNWPHRPQDLELLLTVGRGVIARDAIARPLGAGMCIEYGSDAAMIGMMMTHPKLQAGGLGHEVLTTIQAHLAGRRLRLNATRQAWRLYRSAGFVDMGQVVQYQGTVTLAGAVPHHAGMRAARPQDLTGMLALDRRVFGADRAAVMARLLRLSEARVIVEAGEVTGFALCRSFGRGRLVGPLIAPDETTAIALVGAFMAELSGRFLRLDADARHGGLARFLNASGLDSYDTVVPMTKGPAYGPEAAPAHVYALASQALG